MDGLPGGSVAALSPTTWEVCVLNPSCVRKGIRCKTGAKPIIHISLLWHPNREQLKWKLFLVYHGCRSANNNTKYGIMTSRYMLFKINAFCLNQMESHILENLIIQETETNFLSKLNSCAIAGHILVNSFISFRTGVLIYKA